MPPGSIFSPVAFSFSHFMNTRRRHFHHTRSRWWPVMVVLALFAALTQQTFSPCGFELPENVVASQHIAAILAPIVFSHAEQTADHHNSNIEGTQKGSEHHSKGDADCCVSADESAVLSATVQASVPAVVHITFAYPVVSVVSPLLPLHLKSGALYGRAGPADLRPLSHHSRSSLFNRHLPFWLNEAPASLRSALCRVHTLDAARFKPLMRRFSFVSFHLFISLRGSFPAGNIVADFSSIAGAAKSAPSSNRHFNSIFRTRNTA